MKRAGWWRGAAAAGAALLGWSCVARVPSPPTRAIEPLVRVGVVVDQPSATFGATGQYWVVGSDSGILGSVAPGVTWSVGPGAGPNDLRLTRPDRPAPHEDAQPVTVRPMNGSDLVVAGGHRYRGELVLLRGSVGVTVVNRVPLETYVRAVTAVELGVTDPAVRQAVMAQAVASRTFAVHSLGRRQALGFDVYATVADQVYPGADAEKPEVTAAVRATAGQIVTWHGQAIEALFFSTCGWSTEAADQVFRDAPNLPYLRAVSDRFGPGPRDYYCAASPYFRWTERWGGAALTAVLDQTLPAALGTAAAHPGQVTDIRVAKTTPTGRVAELAITTTTGTYTVPIYQVRAVLRPAPDSELASTLFQLYVKRQGAELAEVTAAGAGAGHGVGMCQWGAMGRARAGQSYQQILATYYPGTQMERLY